jgi:hypothetical protein
MRINTILWWGLGFFFLIMGVVYTVWNVIEHPSPASISPTEWVGTVALFFTMAMCFMVAFYLQRTHKSQGGELPEDILTSEIDDGDPELGHFSPWSWWPMVLAGAASVFMVGLAVGHFLLPVGLALFVVAIVGWTYEYYRGYFAR